MTLHGIAPRAVFELFRLIEDAPDSCRFTVRMSCVEIYMERVRDLLNLGSNNLPIRQDSSRGVFVSGAREEYVASPDEMLGLLAQGT
jgi:kinesin family protein 5